MFNFRRRKSIIGKINEKQNNRNKYLYKEIWYNAIEQAIAIKIKNGPNQRKILCEKKLKAKPK